MADEVDLLSTASYTVRAFARAFQTGDYSEVPVCFSQAVLQKYRGQPGIVMFRTNNAGRVEYEGERGRWKVDFGINDEQGIIHAGLAELMHKLPRGERDHWAQHVVTPPLNEKFIKMRLGMGVCLEEGEIRDL